MKKYDRDASEQPKSIADLLAMPEAVDIEFEPPRLPDIILEVPDLSK